MKMYSLFIFISVLLACNTASIELPQNLTTVKDQPLTYLALGDSYTIGEGVSEKDRYPNILVEKLNTQTELKWGKPEIIAKTGWTVDELDKGINEAAPTGTPYDLVTLLIGVNNQYRGRSVDDYRVDFELMLLRAIGFAGNRPNRVVVVSIPDWGVTPFADKRSTDKQEVAAEIDAYNQAKKSVCGKLGVKFIDITTEYRQIGTLPEMVVADQLHPSGLVYESWAEKIFNHVKTIDIKP
ncbi:SGNH/GDSL hydrolase family protein [Algoriphagus sp. NBT04N3]|nr:SGNH/GDSL hydrolase family protein [Algoriphagus sp. NBT04N3]